MKEVAIVAYAQTEMVRDCGAKNDVEMVMEVCGSVKEQTGWDQHDIDFTCSGNASTIFAIH